jgi:hypothetical protein
MWFNPEDIFNRMSGGASSFDVAKVELRQRGPETVEQQREKMMTFLQTKGVTNGQMTKELYVEFFEARMKERGKEMADRNFQSLSRDGTSFDVNKVEFPPQMLWGGSADRQREKMNEFLRSKSVTNGQMTKELYTEFNEWRMKEFREKGDTRTEAEKQKDEEARGRDLFKALDTDKDNALSKDEVDAGRRNRAVGQDLLDNFDRIDANKSGKIELDEFLKYLQERRQNWERRRDEEAKKAEEAQPGAQKESELDKRPTVYRIGKMPKDLPPWFTQLDTDLDGQVGLYEWKKAGKEVAEFLAMDINGDGFVTVEELLRWQKAQKKVQDSKNGVGSAAAGGQPAPGAAPAAGGPPAGGQGPQRFGKMDWKGGGNKMDFKVRGRKGGKDKGNRGGSDR